MSEEHKIFVFHEKELELILEKLGLMEKMKAGLLKCSICGKVVNKENFGAFMKKNGGILVFCDECINYGLYNDDQNDIRF